MGLPMAEVILVEALIIESHERAQMAPSLLFVIASFGGLLACVVLCLICSECYSRFRNRQTYDGINQSSSGEHELPVTQPIQIRRNPPSAFRPIPSPPPSYNQVQRETRYSRWSRQPDLSYVPRLPELERRVMSQTHQSRRRGAHRFTSRAGSSSRSPSLHQVNEKECRATPYPRPALSFGPRIRITNTPPLLFDKVVSESVQYGLPEPYPNCQTMPKVCEAVRQAILAGDSEPIPTSSNLAGADSTPSPSFDEVITGTERTANTHPRQSARREFQAIDSISSAEAAAILELTQIAERAENDTSPNYSAYSILSNDPEASFENSYIRRMNELANADGSPLQARTPPPAYVSILLSPPPSYSDRMMPDHFDSPPIQYSPTWARFRPAFLRVITPPSTPSDPHVSEEDQLQFQVSLSSKSEEADGKTGIESSTEAENAAGGMLKAKGAISKDKEDGEVFKTEGATAKLKSEMPTTEMQRAMPKAQDAESRTETEWALPKTKGRPRRIDKEWVQPKSKTEPSRSEIQWGMPKAQGATSRTETEWDLSKTKGRPPRTDTEFVQPKSREAAVMIETEWAMLDTEGATAMAEAKWDMPKPDVAEVSTEIECHMPETNISRTRSNRELAMAEGATASVSIRPLISEMKDFRFVDLTESSDSTGNLETVKAKVEFGGARPKVLSKTAKKKKRKRKSKK